jgi:hypothetical protein
MTLNQKEWQTQANGTIMVNVTGLSDVTNYTIRAIIIENDNKSTKEGVKNTSFTTTACKREGFYSDTVLKYSKA